MLQADAEALAKIYTYANNEKERDTQIVNALAAILKELESVNKNLGNLKPNKKGK